MALILDSGKETIKVIASRDGAITSGDEGYKVYQETLDEVALGLKGEPTRFVLRKTLSFDGGQKIKTEQAGVDPATGKISVKLGYVMEDIRMSLIGVDNPGSPSVEFKKDSDGYASKELIALLEANGIVNELFAARQAHSKGNGAVKKS